MKSLPWLLTKHAWAFFYFYIGCIIPAYRYWPLNLIVTSADIRIKFIATFLVIITYKIIFVLNGTFFLPWKFVLTSIHFNDNVGWTRNIVRNYNYEYQLKLKKYYMQKMEKSMKLKHDTVSKQTVANFIFDWWTKNSFPRADIKSVAIPVVLK